LIQHDTAALGYGITSFIPADIKTIELELDRMAHMLRSLEDKRAADPKSGEWRRNASFAVLG
jgi:hypothetical protein